MSAMTLLALLQRDEGGSLFRLLLLAAIFFAPAIGRLLKKIQEGAAGGARPPRPRPKSREEVETPPTRHVSWEELLRGEAPEAEPPTFEALEPSEPELSAGMPAGWEEHLEHDEEFLAPRGILAELPTEGELEHHGGDMGQPLVADEIMGEELGSLPTGGEQLFAGFRGIEGLERSTIGDVDAQLGSLESSAMRVQPSSAWRPARGDWQRAIVAREVLGPPLALRQGEEAPGARLS